MRRVAPALLAALSCAHAPAASPGAPAAVAASAPRPIVPTLRLPAGVEPTRYALDLTIDPEAEPFTGTVRIALAIARDVDVVWLHATDLTLGGARFEQDGATAPARLVPGDEDFVGFARSDGKSIARGAATLVIEFAGTLDSTRSRGLYRVAEGGRQYVYSFFEPVDARRAFPCFDEPAFKVPWRVTLHVPRGDVALGNAAVAGERDEAGARKAVELAETPPLPSYLVAFVVGPFDIVDGGTAGNHGTPLRFVVPHGRGGETRWAREITPRIVALEEDYTAVPYPYGKLDVAVVPRYWGTMEHPGLVALGQTITLIPPERESVGRREFYADIAAHELGHYWFGDYVTMRWWDDTWLNESLAQWFDARITDALEPAWRFKEDRLVELRGAMDADGVPSAKPIRQPVTSKHGIADAFDAELTYLKGEAVLEMFEGWLGEERFRGVIRRHLGRHAWGNAGSDDFLATLGDAAGPSVARAFASFLEQPGVPAIAFELRCDGARASVHLAQHRFLPLGTPATSNQRWQVPVCVRFAAGEAGRACTLLDGAQGDLALAGARACPAALVANADGAGYYRVEYTRPQLDALLAAGSVPTLRERLVILSDVAARVKQGGLPLADALALLPSLVRGGERQLVEAALAILHEVRRELLPPSLRPAFARLVVRTFGERARQLGWTGAAGEPLERRRERVAIVPLVAWLGEEPTLVADAGRLARAWLTDRRAVDPDLARDVLTTAARHGDRALLDAYVAAARATDDRTDRTHLIGALGAFEDPALADAALALVLDGGLDLRETLYIPSTMMRSLPTRDRAWAFLERRWDDIAARLRSDDLAGLLRVVGAWCEEPRIAEAEAFFTPRAAKIEGAPRVVASLFERSRQCVALAARNRESLEQLLQTYQ